MTRRVADCRDIPSESHCTLTISGEEAEVVRAAMEQLFQRIAATVPGSTVVSPYSAEGAHQISRHGTIAFAAIGIVLVGHASYGQHRDMGRGAVAAVYLAIDEQKGQPVALKTLSLADLDLQSEMSALQQNLQSLRPEFGWGGRQSMPSIRPPRSARQR